MSSDRTPADRLTVAEALRQAFHPGWVATDGGVVAEMAVSLARLAELGYRVSPIPDDNTRALAARARALLDAATPGPWEAYYTIHGEPFVTLPGLPITHGIAAVSTGSVDGERDDYGRANAELIAAAPTLIADLLAALLDGQPQDRPDRCPTCGSDKRDVRRAGCRSQQWELDVDPWHFDLPGYGHVGGSGDVR